MSAIGGMTPLHTWLSLMVIFHSCTSDVLSQRQLDFTCLDVCSSISYEDPAECLNLCEALLDGFAGTGMSSTSTEDELNSFEERNKRLSSAFVRIGRDPYYRPGRQKSTFVRIGRSTDKLREQLREQRGSSFVRIGKRQDELFPELQKKPSSFVRIGKKSLEDELDKRPSGLVRLDKGPAGPFAGEKRVSSFVRIGRGDAPEELANQDKRASSFVRIGKKPSSFVRIGKSSLKGDQVMPVEDLARYYQSMSQLLSKRPSSFVRIGRSIEPGQQGDRYRNQDKLERAFYRINRKDNDERQEEKRPSSFVRIGKSQYDAKGIGEKRPSSFVRIGKKASSFVRIGKSDTDTLELPGESQLDSLNGMEKRPSNFVRIGKRSDEMQEQ